MKDALTTLARRMIDALWCACGIASMALMVGCATPASQEQVSVSRGFEEAAASRNILVLFDGTLNGPQSETNIWRLKAAVEASGANARVLYVEGVGSADNPLLGPLWGVGMEPRILRGYRFLSREVRSGDRIFIAGFSRGAHEARAMAGLIAYAGLMDLSNVSDKDALKIGNRVLEYTKTYTDSDVAEAFRTSPEVPPLGTQASSHVGVALRPAGIAFLGLWDTVPGSFFKDYDTCRELPDARPGERYKTGSYPSVKQIVHAVSMDEKRHRFAPILLCPAVVEGRTQLDEVWFSGAHADVGGGYADGGLPAVSLAWMLGHLAKALGTELTGVSLPDPHAPAHWPLDLAVNRLLNDCKDRVMPRGAIVHGSAQQRLSRGNELVLRKIGLVEQPYPPECPSTP